MSASINDAKARKKLAQDKYYAKNRLELNAKMRDRAKLPNYKAARIKAHAKWQDKILVERPIQFACDKLFRSARYRAEQLNLSFDLTVDFIKEKWNANPNCECCGILLKPQGREKSGLLRNSPSLDRFIPEQGYVKTNVSLLCLRCNSAKSDLSLEEVENLLLWMKGKVSNAV